MREASRSTNADANSPTASPAWRGVSRQADGKVEIGKLRGADFLNGIPVLAPRFGFARPEEAEIRLVVRVNAGHDFNVRPANPLLIRVGEITVPSVSELVIPPSPLFFAR